MFMRVLFPAMIVLAAGSSRSAQPSPLGVDRLVLPMSGLELELAGEADRPGYQISGEWRLGAEDFSSLDTIDELRGGALASRTWVNIDRPEAESCAEEIASLPLEGAWKLVETDFWGGPITVRGGTRVVDELGRRPVLLLCATRPDRRRLLVVHTVANASRLTKAALIQRVQSSALVARTWQSFVEGRTQTVQSAWHPDVSGSGEPAARKVKLPEAKVTVGIPDDGFVWQLAPGAIDTFIRRVPADPELSLDVIVRPHEGCVQSFYELGASGAQSSSAKNLPQGWMVGGRALVAGSEATVACRLVRNGTLTVAVHRSPRIENWKELEPMMDALVRAVGSDLAPGTRVEVEWHGSWLEARIREIRGATYFVDFDDKDESWNEWVPRERVRRR